METHSTYPYQKNLEPIEAEIRSGHWRIAAFIDRISNKKFLRFRLRHPDSGSHNPGLFDFRGKSASAISPQNCPRLLYTAANEEHIELLTQYVHPLKKKLAELESLRPIIKSLIGLLAHFERYDFHVTELSTLSIGIGDDGELRLLPNAYMAPPGWAVEGSAQETARRAAAQPKAHRPAPIPSPQLSALAVLMMDLAADDSSANGPADPGEIKFKQAMLDSAAEIGSGGINSLAELHQRLFAESLPRALRAFPRRRAGSPLSSEAETFIHSIHQAAGERRVIILKGGAFTGKSTLLDKTAEHFKAQSNGEWQILRPDEWSLFSKPQKGSLPKGSQARKILWVVDDLADRPYVFGYFSRWLADETTGANSVLLLSFDPRHASTEVTGYLEKLKARLKDQCLELSPPDQLYQEKSPGEGTAAPARTDGHTPANDGARPHDRLEDYLFRLIDHLNTESAAGQSRSLEHSANTILELLPEEERQLLELVSVARLAVPLDITSMIFPDPERPIHRSIHRLAALGLLNINFQPAGKGQELTPLISSRSASIRRLVYEIIPDERKKNLHRTMALHAEERASFPEYFLIYHLLEGNEGELAAKHCLTYLNQNDRDIRDPLILELCLELIHQNYHQQLPLADQLFILHEAGLDFLGNGQAAEAESIFRTAGELLDGTGLEERRKHTKLTTSIRQRQADAWESKGEYKKALDLLDAVYQELQPVLNLADQAKLLNDMGWFHYRLGNYEQSMESCKLSLTSLPANQHPLIVAQALNIMGVVHYNTSQYDEAIRYFDRCALLRDRAGDENALSGTYNNLALANQTKGEYDKALGYYQKSLEIKKRQNNQVGIAAAYLNLALLSLELQDLDKAEQRCRDSLAIASELGAAMLTAEIYSTLGDITAVRGENEAAEKYYLDCLQIARDYDSKNVEMGAHRRLSTLYLNLNQYEKSRHHVDKSAGLARLIGSKYESAQIDMILGDLESAQHKQMEALEHYEKAASTFTTLSRNRLASSALAKIGLLHVRAINTFEAMQYLDRAESLIRSDFGHVLPEEIITLRNELKDHPARSFTAGKQSQNLLMSFYELSLLFESTFDRQECFRRILDMAKNIIGPDECRLIIKTEGKGYSIFDDTKREKELQDEGLIELINRTLLLGCVLDSASPDIEDISTRVDVGGGGFACIPLKAMGSDLGCLLFYIPSESLPLSKENLNFFTALGRNIAGTLTLMFHLEDHAHKEERLSEEVEALKAQVEDQYRYENLIGKSDSMRKIFRTLEKLKDMDTGILIIGDSGTGKTELARAIHYNSLRSNKVFQDIHCAQIPESLLESELFGHERGAFTGAVQRKLGLCEKADGGTIFLDDINVIPMTTQSKLLNFLESKQFNRLGGTQRIVSNVRILAASNEDLEELCEQGKFRKDLFYRLNVIQIRIPPLRERKEDILAIALDYLNKRCAEEGKVQRTLAPETIRLFQNAPWEGNVRELQHVIEQIILLSDDIIVTPNSLPENFLERVSGIGGHPNRDLEALAQQIIQCGSYSKARPLIPQVEAILAKKMVDFTDQKTRAAELLGITKPTLYARLRYYDKMN